MQTNAPDRVTKSHIQELTAANRSYELQIQELLAANERLQALDNTRRQFTLHVTHALRAPVAAIHSYLKLMLEGYVPEERQREMLERSAHRTRELLDRIADLLELGKVQQRAFTGDVQAVQVGDSLEAVCEMVHSWAEDRQVTIQLKVDEGLAPVQAVPDHVEQLWMNLVSNSIKYTRSGGRATCTVSERDGYVVGSVQDTGIGIAKKDQARVFEGFFRTEEARAMERQGTGLGLSIVKHIVDLYEGQVELESEPGAGTTVTFGLPASTVEAQYSPCSPGKCRGGDAARAQRN